MRTLIGLALLIPALAFAAPTEREWKAQQGQQVEVVFVDGTTVSGTVVAVENEQVRVRTDDGSMTMIPMGVVSEVNAAERPVTAERPPPPQQSVEAPRRGPTVGVGVGVGMGPVSVGVGGVTGPRGNPPASVGGRYNRNIVGVRYPLRGRETVDFLLFDEKGGKRSVPDDLLRPRALREYQFVDEWGQSVPWQAVWVGMGAEREYVDEIKRIDRTMLPLRATETVLGLGGIGLLIYTFVQSGQNGTSPYGQPGWIAGSAMIVGNIGFSLGVTGPTRNRMRVQLGQKSLDRAQAYYATGGR